MTGRRYLSCSTCGWRSNDLPPVTDRLAARFTEQLVTLAHVVSGRLTDGRVHRVTIARDVRLFLDVDVAQFGQAMARAGRAVAGQLETIRWNNIVRSQRAQARMWWDQTAEAAWARYGWQRPAPSNAAWPTHIHATLKEAREIDRVTADVAKTIRGEG